MTREERIAQTVETAIAACPSLAVARLAVENWRGDPHDPGFKADVLAELIRRQATELPERKTA